MDYIKYFSNIFSGIGGITAFIAIIIIYKTGLLEFLTNLKKNGDNNLQEKQFKELYMKIESLGDNHLEHLNNKIDKLVENTTKELILLEDIRNHLKK